MGDYFDLCSHFELLTRLIPAAVCVQLGSFINLEATVLQLDRK
jgi:hypothetical protein